MMKKIMLTFPPCEEMFRMDKPKYSGEPSIEKPNRLRAPGMADWQFKFHTVSDKKQLSLTQYHL
jgi:hypothetical protein